VTAFAGIVLAGGRSSRMGTQKAALDWHGQTLLARTVEVLARATGGPVVVVRARGQVLPDLPGVSGVSGVSGLAGRAGLAGSAARAAGVLVVEDPRPGKGPLQGIAAGLAALAGDPAANRAGPVEAAFVAATDMPFLHPAFVRRVLAALTPAGPDQVGPDGRVGPDGPGAPGPLPDVALPVARGYPQPLAAAYRVRLAPLADALVASGRLRPADLFATCAVLRLDEARLLADPALAAADPGLDSLVNVNDPAQYAAALARPAPETSSEAEPQAETGAETGPGRD
jgi:molybdopterin-guanine dinucleotide biosynthesis protein A